MSNKTVIELDGGKYRYELENGRQEAYRYGELWRDLTGDNLVYWMACEIVRLRTERDAFRDLLDQFDRYDSCDPEYLESPLCEKVRRALGRPEEEL